MIFASMPFKLLCSSRTAHTFTEKDLRYPTPSSCGDAHNMEGKPRGTAIPPLGLDNLCINTFQVVSFFKNNSLLHRKGFMLPHPPIPPLGLDNLCINTFQVVSFFKNNSLLHRKGFMLPHPKQLWGHPSTRWGSLWNDYPILC